VNWKRKRITGQLVDGHGEVLEVPLRALWREARGGGGRLRQATERRERR